MELYHHPVNTFVAGFLGSPSMNFIDVHVNAVREGEVEVKSESLEAIWIPSTIEAPKLGERLLHGVRPQYLLVCTDTHEGKLHGKVLITERLGTETVVDLSLTDQSRVIASVAEDTIFSENQEVSLTFNPLQTHLFRD